MADRTVGDMFPTVDLPTTSAPDAATQPSPHGLPNVPGYDVLEVIGRGGMGIVYRAMQRGLKRPVALKMILAGERATPSQLARFRAEAESIARLQHPNIVLIHNVGEADGHPFLAMEYVPGGTLFKRVGGHPQPAKQAARLVQILAHAMHCAHQNGIIHRDLKPGNILLALAVGSRPSEDSSPEVEAVRVTSQSSPALASSSSEVLDLAAWTPKISDFGLAKQLGETSGQTHTNDLIGTPSYMAPEQAPGAGRRVTPATDVYALGAILYWCLTGRPPFRGETVLDTLEQVRSREPVPPRRLHVRVPLDLETVCLKCLQKDPSKRYPTAQELGDDLGRFLTGNPIKARRVSQVARAWRWCRRHPELAVWITAATVFLLAGSAFSFYFGLKAQVKQREAEERAEEARVARELGERRSYGQRMRLAYEAWKNGQMGAVRQYLTDAVPGDPKLPDRRGFEWYYLDRLCRLELYPVVAHATPVFAIASSPDGRLFASAGADQQIKLWETATGRELRSISDKATRVNDLAFSPDGRLLAAACWDDTVKLWDAKGGRLLRIFRGHGTHVNAVAFLTDGRRIVSGSSDRTARLWEVATGRELLQLHQPGFIRGVAVSLDGKCLATSSFDGALRLWDLERGKELRAIPGQPGSRAHVAFSPDGRWLAATSGDTVVIHDRATGEQRQTLRGHDARVTRLSVSPDGKRIATASEDCTVRTWDATTGDVLTTLRGHSSGVYALAFIGPDGRRVASGGEEGAIKVWDPNLAEAYTTLRGHLTALTAVIGVREMPKLGFSPDGQRLVSGGQDGLVLVWDTRSARPLKSLRGHQGIIRDLAVGPDGSWAASAGEDGTVRVWDLEEGTQRFSLKGHEGTVWGVAISPDGSRIASAGDDHSVRIWDSRTGRLLHVLDQGGAAVAVAFSPDGRLLVTGGEGGNLRFWSPATGEITESVPSREPLVRCITFSPAGGEIAWGGASSVHVWNRETRRHTRAIRGVRDTITSIQYSPDGKRLITNCPCEPTPAGESAARLWDAVTGDNIMTLPGPGRLGQAILSPDGLLLAAAVEDGTIRFYDVRPEQPDHQVDREARGIVKFLADVGLSEPDMLTRIRSDLPITDAVRRRALSLAGPYGNELVRSAALRLVQPLFAMPLLRDEVLARLRAEPGISDRVRQEALAVAKDYPEDAIALAAAAELTAGVPGATVHEYEHALRQAQTAWRLLPSDCETWLALGMAQYRVGHYADAVATLKRREASKPREDPLLTLQRHAFLAMAQYRAGTRADALRRWALLQEEMNHPFGSGRQSVADSWFRETEAVILGRRDQPAR